MIDHRQAEPELGEEVRGEEAEILRAWRLLTDEQRAEVWERLRREAFS